MILVIAEQREGRLNRASWETIAAAQQMGGDVTVLVPGAQVGAVASELASAQVKEVVTVEHAALEPYTPDGFTAALQDAIGQLAPERVLLPHTYQTRDFAPKLAARLDRALVTDVTAVKTAGGETADRGAGAPGLVFVRPMFQGKLTADVAPQGPAPHFITFQIGAFRVDQAAKGSSPAPVRALTVTVDAAAIRERPEAPFQQAKQAVDLSQAERIVSVGRGIKEQANIHIAESLAQAIGAEIAASRPICDAGWLPMERQVGSSGQTVAPKLYLALGISGAIQHLVGMKGANTIVAINKDPDAPIFEVADYGIVGDLFEVIPAMIDALKA
jgi:electron transfer flavoprotein alpha subunit